MKKQTRPLISLENLTIGYGNRVIVQNLDFNINRGDVFIIMGMSGCGKSTIMRSIIGLQRPIGGKVLIDGRDLWKMDDAERAKVISGFGVMFQSGALFSSMTVGENVALPMELKTDLSRAKIDERVREKLKIVGLDGYANFYPSEISGGMVRRAALARAMALNPEVLFFDEPSAGLDPLRSRQLDDLILEINRKTGTTIVMVTHELPSIMTIATNSVYIDVKTKSVGAYGAPKDILKTTKNPEIVAFLSRGNKGGKK